MPRNDADGERLVFGTERVASAPIRYEQPAFVEAQWAPPLGTQEEVADDQRFVATKAIGDPYERWARDWREQGRLVRLWEFGEARRDSAVNPNIPAGRGELVRGVPAGAGRGFLGAPSRMTRPSGRGAAEFTPIPPTFETCQRQR